MKELFFIFCSGVRGYFSHKLRTRDLWPIVLCSVIHAVSYTTVMDLLRQWLLMDGMRLYSMSFVQFGFLVQLTGSTFLVVLIAFTQVDFRSSTYGELTTSSAIYPIIMFGMFLVGTFQFSYANYPDSFRVIRLVAEVLLVAMISFLLMSFRKRAWVK